MIQQTLVEQILNVGDGPGMACSVLHVNVSSENTGHHNLLIGEVAQLLLWTGYSYSVYRNDATMAAGSANMATMATMSHKKVHAVLAMFLAAI